MNFEKEKEKQEEDFIFKLRKIDYLLTNEKKDILRLYLLKRLLKNPEWFYKNLKKIEIALWQLSNLQEKTIKKNLSWSDEYDEKFDKIIDLYQDFKNIPYEKRAKRRREIFEKISRGEEIPEAKILKWKLCD